MITRSMEKTTERTTEKTERNTKRKLEVEIDTTDKKVRKKVRKIYEDDSFSIRASDGSSVVGSPNVDSPDVGSPDVGSSVVGSSVVGSSVVGSPDDNKDVDMMSDTARSADARSDMCEDTKSVGISNDARSIDVRRNEDDIEDFADRVSSENQHLYNKLEKKLKKLMPSMDKILAADVSNKHKVELLQLFFVYDYEYPNTENKLLIQEKINNLLKKYEKEYKLFLSLSDEERQSIKKELKLLQNYDEKLSLENQIALLPSSLSVKQVIYREYKRLNEIRTTDDEYPKLKDWIHKCLSIPFNAVPINITNTFISSAKTLLDKKLYGMNNVKEQILLYLNAKINRFEDKHNVLGLLGPPGVGKTAIARSLSEILNLPFAQISCTNVKDVSVLRGHSYTYIGSKCGEILEAVIKLKSKTGIIFLDEFGLVSNDEIVSTFLDILDPVQNKEYYDVYIGKEIPIDLSGIWFILSMNELPMNNALQDRIFPINVKGYNREEKCVILENYIIPKLLKEVKCDEFIFPKDTIKYIVDIFGKTDPGLRGIMYNTKNIIHKLAFLKYNDVDVSYRIKLNRMVSIDAVNKLSDTDKNDQVHFHMFM